MQQGYFVGGHKFVPLDSAETQYTINPFSQAHPEQVWQHEVNDVVSIDA